MGSCCIKNSKNPGESSISCSSDIFGKSISVEDFAIKKIIGKGAFAKVFLVRNKQEDKIYAMKVLRKKDIREVEEKHRILLEREVLANIDHPFIIKLHTAFQSSEKLYFVLDFVNGGELYTHLTNEGIFSVEKAKFYAAEITLALECLHQNDIIYRDLKPQNILLDYQGHIKLVDFGLCKKLSKKGLAYSILGSPDYIAPEILTEEGHDKCVDWWSLGILIYRMLSGRCPFTDVDPESIFERIQNDDLNIPDSFTEDQQSIVSDLLEKNPKRRLGSGPQDAEIIKDHPFFEGIDWEELMHKRIQPPFSPPVADEEDLCLIDPQFVNEKLRESDFKRKTLTSSIIEMENQSKASREG
ncbi:unnamed protein product [Moneuplotes crassus]|uniref:Uncharacterized protein n=1 Tax=Euplotes crassus TaxID=5936 RepID=A0AAD1XHX7_EUPCR|nr:unnamed protein product [Moneuplotes crassus]